jgi:hypothetical protein
MAIAEELKKTLTASTPLYAVAGAGDLVVEKLRELRVDITTDPKALRERIQTSVASARESVQTLPDRTQSLADKTQSFAKAQAERTQSFAKARAEQAKVVYEDLAARGHKLVDRVDRQESTGRAEASPRTTKSKAKATATAAKRGAVNARSQAKATATAAAGAADAAARAIEQGAEKVGDAKSAPSTRGTGSAAKSDTPAG